LTRAAYTEVQLLTDSGALREQGEIEARMIRKAAKLGADALIFDTPVKEGGELQGFSCTRHFINEPAPLTSQVGSGLIAAI
jgi:hypothetical protein